MAKKLVKKTKVSKDQLASSIRTRISSSGGAGRSAIIPQKIEENLAKDRAGTIKELSLDFAIISIKEIEPNPDQPRTEFEERALKELAESIKIHGVIQPITVRQFNAKEYQIISGERRWRASQIAGLTEIPAYIRVADDQQMMEMALIENIQRENLNPFEIAISYYRLKEEFGLTDHKLAERVGKSRSAVTHFLGLLDMHVEVIESLKKLDISMGHAKAIKGIKDKLLQKEALDKILATKMSVREAEKMAKSYGKSPEKKSSKKTNLPLDYQDILNDFKAFFGSGRIQLKLEDKESGKGQIVIPFSSNEELNYFFKCVEQG